MIDAAKMNEIPVLDAPPVLTPDPEVQKRPYIRKAKVKRGYKRHTKEDAVRVGVAATAGDTGPAHAPRDMEDGQEVVTRQSLEARQQNMFDLPEHRKKRGRDYKGETITVMGQTIDGAVLMDAHMSGWRAEKAKDWPEMGPEGTPHESLDERYGMRLMGRPVELSHEAQIEAYNRAKQQERDRMQAVSTGQSVGGTEGLANIKGVQVKGASLDIQLAVGARQ